MTHIAQIALKCLMQEFNENVRYCLICNYISKIDYSLQHEFIKIRFDKLPKKSIQHFIKNILSKESNGSQKKGHVNSATINNIIDYYETDVRSMINYLQTNSCPMPTKTNILNNKIYEKIFLCHTQKTERQFKNCLDKIVVTYKTNISIVIKKYVAYLIRNKYDIIYTKNIDIINELEYIIHNIELVTNENKDIYMNLLYYSIV